ncbi:uncharacterized protein YpmB [Salibacterium salarium]|uniref:hypothetical protein n=1 Tax=Salibacterium salarium TaxID=284579 RepID=UPI0027835CD3|nr:hypothetical protein [Salibacterium salarium]MDQ0299405.1 uncharacterized protein YpmB [Salibacterium salarium]
MRRLILGAGFLSLIVLTAGFILFFTAHHPLAKETGTVKDELEAQEGIETVKDVDYYYGETEVYTADTIRDNGTEEWIFIQENSVIDRINKEDGLSRAEAENTVLDRFDLEKVRSLKLGMEDRQALYEATFEIDNTLYFYYMTFEDGEFIKRYSVQKS